jgi:hypothetical protein
MLRSAWTLEVGLLDVAARGNDAGAAEGRQNWCRLSIGQRLGGSPAWPSPSSISLCGL